MGSYLNFENFGQTPLARQSTIFSLTFDEFQNTLGGLGKDFGSMNMDELLKNILTAEETQAMASSSGDGEGTAAIGNMQRQGSLKLPRTISQKTVDEVWRDLLKESSGGSHLQLRQPTLREMTLWEFLVRAGVVREDNQAQPNNNTRTFGFQQSAQNNGVPANWIAENNDLVPNQSSSLPLNVTGVRSSQQFQHHQQQHQQPQLLFPKQASVALVQGIVMQSGVVGMTGLGTGTSMFAAGSPVSQLSTKSSVDTSSLSPPPYMFSEGIQGRKCGGTLEKTTERRHRRMIKNRESAARSRARKQAYTLELEAEVAKLKEELQKKEEEIVEMQKNQTMKVPWGSKRRCLRRTMTNPW